MEASVATPPPPAKVTINSADLAELLAQATRAGRDLVLTQVAPPPKTKAQEYLDIHPKVVAGGVSGYLSVIVLYVLQAVWAIEPPAIVAAAITGLIISVCAWLAPRKPASA